MHLPFFIEENRWYWILCGEQGGQQQAEQRLCTLIKGSSIVSVELGYSM